MTEKKKKILIVDDDRLLLDIYTTKFLSGGFEVDTAFSGEEALLAIKKSKPDALLLDIVMPGMDGLEFLKKLKGDRTVQDVKVIILSNQNQPSDAEKAEKLGIDGYIVKASNTPSEVLNKVLSILKSKK